MRDILVVIDMQKDFIYGPLGTRQARLIVPGVVEKIKGFQGEILYTKDTHEGDYLDTQEGRNLPVPHCQMGSEGWELIDEIKYIGEMKEKHVFCKDTFGSRKLAETLLQWNGEERISSITLVGVCTDICVISNGLLIKAYLPEVLLVVDSGCCAGTSEEGHENALLAMKACQIQIKERE